ncbi:MAG: hypothetical protein NTZ69_03250 [Bacteroidia bacterium]|nr:hypothetical protein [Bacteroidia bacterium]
MGKILSFLCLFLTINAFAQTEAFDIVSFKPPQNWTRAVNQEMVSFTTSKGNLFCVAGIYKSRPINAIAESEFITEWNELVNQPYGLKITPVIKRSEQNGWTVFSGSADVKTTQSGNFIASLTSFAAKGKIISAMINSNSALYKAEADAFLSSIIPIKQEVAGNIKLPSAVVAKTAEAVISGNEVSAADQGIAGVWVGFENGKFVFGVTSHDYVNNRNNYGSIYNASVAAIKWRVFWNDGKYYDGMPNKGLIDFDRNDPANDYAGYYSMDKNTATAKMDHYSSAQRMYVFYPPNKLKFMDKYEYVKCQSVDGLILNETYISADPMSTAYYNSIKEPVPTISFASDGRFTDDNYIGDYSKDAQLAPGSGTYEIHNFTLILKYSDGRIVQRSFAPFLNEAPSTCKVFYIGSHEIKLKL